MSDKKTWDKIIYGLIYPGFLGSMLYELIPPDKSNFTWAFFITPDNFIRYLILFFYFLDFAHLYGDMESVIEDPNRKPLRYFLCDILTCFGYLFSFIALKAPPNYLITIIVFGTVPWLFLWYKWKNIADRKYYFPYGIVTSALAIYRCLYIGRGNLLPFRDQDLALLMMIINVSIYLTYVMSYYEEKSVHLDKTKVYPRRKRA
ncbi:MAG TPA: hypothetical protein VF543_19110 [Pyrinomonadaceae bacterium]|jgi:hypothetical protein